MSNKDTGRLDKERLPGTRCSAIPIEAAETPQTQLRCAAAYLAGTFSSMSPLYCSASRPRSPVRMRITSSTG